jgi:tetratricopeptide (TPR) repeat protein
VASIVAQRLSVPLPSSLPRALRDAVLRGLRVDPAERHPDMPTLLRTLGPARGPRRRPASWVAVAALASGGAWWAMHDPPPAEAHDYCVAVAERLEGAWDDARREQARQAFEATGLSYAADTWARTRERMDAQASAWVEAQREACEAAAAHERRGEGEITNEREHGARQNGLDRQMVCLHRRLAEIRQLGDLLVAADAALVERAPQAVEALGSIESCTASQSGPSEGETPGALERVEVLARIQVLQEAGRYEDAVAAAEAAVATMGASAGRSDAAVQRYHDAFSAAVAAGHHAAALNAALGLADVIGRATQPRFDEAERWVEHAAAALAQRGETPGQLARIEAARGRIDHERGDYAAALEHFERALAVRTEELGPDHYLLASHHNNLGHTYAALERQHEGIEHERRSLELERAHYGQEHPRVGRALAALCASYSDAGRLDEAIAMGSEAVAMLRRTVGEAHPSLGTALLNLGSAQSRAGRHAEAERSFLDALANARLAHGERHRRVGLALNNLGVLYERTERLAEAEQYHRQAAEVFVDVLGPTHPTTALAESNLASVLVHQGKLDEAEGVLRQTLKTLEERLGVDHPDVAVPLALLGQVLMDRGHAKQALPLLERVHALWQPGQAPPEDVAAVLFALGSALWESGEDRKRGIELVTRSHGHYRQLGDARPEKLEETAVWLRERGVRVE